MYTLYSSDIVDIVDIVAFAPSINCLQWKKYITNLQDLIVYCVDIIFFEIIGWLDILASLFYYKCFVIFEKFVVAIKNNYSLYQNYLGAQLHWMRWYVHATRFAVVNVFR